MTQRDASVPQEPHLTGHIEAALLSRGAAAPEVLCEQPQNCGAPSAHSRLLPLGLTRPTSKAFCPEGTDVTTVLTVVTAPLTH